MLVSLHRELPEVGLVKKLMKFSGLSEMLFFFCGGTHFYFGNGTEPYKKACAINSWNN